MNFKNLRTTQLGDMGEQYIPEFCKAKNSKAYQPTIEGSNPVDGMCITNNTYKLFGVEVKTKASMLYKPMTGMDLADHKTYLQLPFPTYVLFVDWLKQEIYGQWISKLDKVVEEIDDIVLYPLSAMTTYRKLTGEEITKIKGASNSSYYN